MKRWYWVGGVALLCGVMGGLWSSAKVEAVCNQSCTCSATAVECAKHSAGVGYKVRVFGGQICGGDYCGYYSQGSASCGLKTYWMGEDCSGYQTGESEQIGGKQTLDAGLCD